MHSPTLCLCMIVKNESAIITRLFNTVVPIIDCYCICDTGSTDNTIDIIKDFFIEKNIPGKIIQEPFKDFSYNRNLAMQSAIGMSDHIILLDADMCLKIGTFDKSMLTPTNHIQILQGNPEFQYLNTRIIPNTDGFKYVGVTHEYLDVPQNSTKICVDESQLFINDIADGGSKVHKYERDISLLLKGLEENPENCRYLFYLANSYHDSAQYDKAIPIYTKRIQLGGWNEETWYSYYRLGCCYKNINNIAFAICTWMDGYNYYEPRIEGLYEIITYYTTNKKYKLANEYYTIAKRILEKKYNMTESLFLFKDIYAYRLAYEYTIFSSEIGNKNINDEVVTILNNDRNLNFTQQTFFNMRKYNQQLAQTIPPILFDSTISITIKDEQIELTSSSSSMIKYNNGYILNIRYVNYSITILGDYICENTNNLITANKFVELDEEFNIIRQSTFNIGEPVITTRSETSVISMSGPEDIRIFHDQEHNKIIFSGTEAVANTQLVCIAIGEYTFNSSSALNHQLIKSPMNTDEKNWSFVMIQQKLKIIYKWYPLTICDLNTQNELNIDTIIPMPLIFAHTHGSTSGYSYYNINKKTSEIWFIVHISSHIKNSIQYYYHMFVVFDKNMKLLRYSAPFTFENQPIEFCLSMIIKDENIIVNYSTWDRTTRIGIYPKKNIDELTIYT